MTDLLTPETVARLNDLEPSLEALRALVSIVTTAQDTTAAKLASTTTDITAKLDAVSKKLDALYLQVNPPPPPPPPPTDTVIVGADLMTAQTKLGMTSVHNQTRNATTAAILAKASALNNQHLEGFGSNTNVQPGAGAAYDWMFHDSTFGVTAGVGYFPGTTDMCITFCGCPPHMRVPKTGTTWDPMGVRTGTQLTSLSDYSPPHSSWMPEYAALCAAFAARYKHVKYFQFWNEFKSLYFVTQYPGSNIVPAGSGLPARPGDNRWWTEGYVHMYNLAWTAIKKVRPDAVIAGPYHVMVSLTVDNPNDWADDPFPMNLNGPWGFADKKVLSSVMYFIANCRGCDLLCMDVHNGAKDTGVTPMTQWFGGQKVLDFQAWVRKLGAYDPVYRRPECNALVIPFCWAEWYAATALDNVSHQEEAATDAWQYINYALLGGASYVLGWKPEGDESGPDLDPANSNPLALWYNGGSAKSLQETELVAVRAGMIKNFPPGTPLKAVSVPDDRLCGVASPTVLCIVSRASTSIDVILGGKIRTIPPFAVQFIPR